MSGSVEMETRSLSEYAREPADLVELAKQAIQRIMPAKNSALGRSVESTHEVYGRQRAAHDTAGSDPLLTVDFLHSCRSLAIAGGDVAELFALMGATAHPCMQAELVRIGAQAVSRASRR